MPSLGCDILFNGLRGALAHPGSIGQIQTAHTGLRCKLMELDLIRSGGLVAEPACQFQGGFALGGFVTQAGQCGTADQFSNGWPRIPA